MKNNLDRYLTDAKRFSTITPKEEIALSKKIQKGDTLALHKLVEANLALVGFLAKRYSNRKIYYEDIISAGNLGLVQAAKRFDWKKNKRFDTYAGFWIKKEINLAIIEFDTYYIPTNRRSIFNKYNKALEKLLQELCVEQPTITQITEAMRIPTKKVREIISDLNATFYISADMPISKSTTTTFKDTYVDTPENETKEQVQEILDSSRITPLEKKMLELHFLEEYTFKELGIIFNYTAVWVGVLVNRAIEKLKKSPMVKNIIFTA